MHYSLCNAGPCVNSIWSKRFSYLLVALSVCTILLSMMPVAFFVVFSALVSLVAVF